MIEVAEIEPGDKVLEVGAGSGYAAAVISRIAAQVYTIERHSSLVIAARQDLRGWDTTISNCASETVH
jgi:protein-L-isoaspartate O-methyltransferase